MDWSNLQKDYERLGSFTAVAKEYGVSKSWVSQKLKQQGWKKPIPWDTMQDLYDSGLTFEQIAERFECGLSNVAYHANRLGVVARKTGSTGWKWTDATREKRRQATDRGAFRTDRVRERFGRVGSTAPKMNSPSEQLLHKALIKARLSFETQGQELGRYFPDVKLHQQPILIEVDGWAHGMPKRRAFDEIRDAALTAAGFRVFRFSDKAVITGADACVQKVVTDCGLTPEPDPVAIIREKRAYRPSA